MSFMKRVSLVAGSMAVSASFLLSACDQPSQQQGGGMPPMGPVEVGVVAIAPSRVVLTSDLSGRVVPVRRAEIRPQVNGLITDVQFREGAEVKAGDPLYQIDAAPYQAAVDAALAAQAKAEAGVDLARLDERRYAELVRTNATSRQNYDNAVAVLKQAQADLAAAKATLAAAQVDLERTHILAPITGRIGRSAVSQGALVKVDQDMTLSTIQQLDPIFVDLTQSNAELLRLKADMARGQLSGVEAGSAKVTLTLEDGSAYELPGELKFSEAVVSESTGSVTLRALFPNPDERLLPGMFVRAKVEVGVEEQGILVPQRGITRTPTGQGTALVVNDKGEVEARQVVAERTVGDAWLVTSGIVAGDKVIVEGLQKIQPGMPVKVVEPTASATPAAQ
ncbi:efflux transporter periplasmic adaptor subunit [Zavarzinia aquatilis]|uniref:Efflux transporter periplasmic adaptor subunit n=2 Tax=Zavarzinia aquatilis TaxID=2211142 RepID=A0A317DX40_9PROT|nr:efflux transporter periplasmic adaptor subunit [Zavarzinia aquatilis]